MMGNVALILLVLLLLLGVLAAGWGVAARRLDVARTATGHWCASALVTVLCLVLMLARGSAPDWLTGTLPPAAAVLAMGLLVRGLQRCLRMPVRDVELGVLALAVLVLPLAWPAKAPYDAAVGSDLLACTALGWLLLRSCLDAWAPLKREFDTGLAFVLLAPQMAAAALLAVRLGGGLVQPQLVALPISSDSPSNVAMALMVLLLGLLAHGALALLVLMRILAKLRRLSQRDALTGLLNRAEWTRQLEAQHRWLGRFGDPFALLLVDIDHFKRINDTLGHAAGDAALVSMSQMLVGSARQVDIVGRLGGEEFGVLLPRTDPMAALRAAERLRQTLAATELTWRGEALRLTVSVGVAIGTDPDESPGDMLERADRALYQAKREGRNRSVVAGIDPIDTGTDEDDEGAVPTEPGPATQPPDAVTPLPARRRA